MFFPRKKEKNAENTAAPPLEKKILTVDEMKAHIIGHVAELPDAQKNEFLEICSKATDGSVDDRAWMIQWIEKHIQEQNIEVTGFTDTYKCAKYVYAYLYGLGAIDDVYYDPEVTEVAVNRHDSIWVFKRNGDRLSIPKEDAFPSPEAVKDVIHRMTGHDNSPFNDNKPTLESVRRDNVRVTAEGFPISTYGFSLRLHGDFFPDRETYKRLGTLDDQVWDILEVNGLGRNNTIISGNVGSGKSTLLKVLVGLLHPKLAILVLGEDLELGLEKLFPDRFIKPLEAHPQIDGHDFKRLAKHALRKTVDLIVAEEFRGAGEANVIAKTVAKGFDGSLTTAHFNSPDEMLLGCAQFMMEEGLPFGIQDAVLRVGMAYRTIVQMLGDPITGVRKVTGIYLTNIVGRDVTLIPLIEWVPDSMDDYYGRGQWVKREKPSISYLNHCRKHHVKDEQLRRLGWIE